MINDSTVYDKKDMISTKIPMVNVALAGTVDGGMTPGLTVIAGPSKHFKSAFALFLAGEFLRKYDDGVVLFYDSEFGTPKAYFDTFQIDRDRVIHSPITNIEMFKHDIMKQISEIARTDKVFILVDSIGNLASAKEVNDALEGKDVTDMTRAKALKSLFRMVTPHLSLLDIPMVVINHTYKTLEMYSKDVVGGGTGVYYSADNIWIVGRQQDTEAEKAEGEKKKGKAKLVGYDFIINIEKSRYVKEKSKITISVNFADGINQWSGLFDLAMEAGLIVTGKQGWYIVADDDGVIPEDAKSHRRDDLEYNAEFWRKLLRDKKFIDFIHDKYSLDGGNMLSNFTNDEVQV